MARIETEEGHGSTLGPRSRQGKYHNITTGFF